MRIAITGSWRDQDAEQWKLRNKAFFFEATSALGAAFAKLGHRLVVATDSKHTADWAAVDGAARAMPQRPVYDRPVVDLLRSGPKTFAEISASRPGFVTALDAPTSGEVTKLYQVHLADVVLAIGGADKTLQATIAAAASGKRVLPVGCFGGAAEQAAQIFGAMATSWGPHIPGNDVIGALRTVWTDGSEELVLRALGVRHPKLLLVHGRDLVSRDALAKLLMRLELPSPVVMAAEPSYGRSLPQKFESLAQGVDAAIALVTPDDVGGFRDRSDDAMRARARQNVWVEFGWFWGKLGRARILLLGKEGIEVPSDLSGLLVEHFRDSPDEREAEICQWIESLGWPKPKPGP